VRLSRSWFTPVLVLIAPCAILCAQDASPARPSVSFSFNRPGLPVPVYQLTIEQGGTGSYKGQEVPQTSGSRGAPDGLPDQPPQPFQRPIHISAATGTRVFDLSRQLNHFNKSCASKAKNVADTGVKILTYSGPDATGSCTYNYTEDKNVQALTDIFQGIAETLDEGRQLDHLHRYDRLGLDAAIKFLAQEVTDGRALEVGVIADSLRSIASDSEVMDRVRARANTLLALAPPAAQ
jgi:hypothetical protein